MSLDPVCTFVLLAIHRISDGDGLQIYQSCALCLKWKLRIHVTGAGIDVSVSTLALSRTPRNALQTFHSYNSSPLLIVMDSRPLNVWLEEGVEHAERQQKVVDDEAKPDLR